MRCRWTIRLIQRCVNRSLQSDTRGHYSTLSGLIEQHLQSATLLSPTPAPHPPHTPLTPPPLSPRRSRSLEEMADACRSLLYGHRIGQAESLFSTLLSRCSHHELDVSLCNVFLEHFLKSDKRASAKHVLDRIGQHADLHTHMLVIRDALARGDMDGMQRALTAAAASGVSASTIMGMSGWSKEDRAALYPLMFLCDLDNVMAGTREDGGRDPPGPVRLAPAPSPSVCTPGHDLQPVLRVQSKSGGVDLMAGLADIFASVNSLSEDELLRAQVRLEEASYQASQVLEMRRKEYSARLTGIPEVDGIANMMARWMYQFAAWLRQEMESRLERGITSPTASLDAALADASSEAEYFCALLSPLEPERIAALTVIELVSMRGFHPEFGGVKMVYIAQQVGKRVREEMMAQVALSRPFLQRTALTSSAVRKMLLSWDGRKQLGRSVELAMAQARERQVEQSQQVWLPSWSTSQAVKLGSWLIAGCLGNISMGDAVGEGGAGQKAPEGEASQKAPEGEAGQKARKASPPPRPFYHTVLFDPNTGHRQGVVRPCRGVLNLLLKGPGSPSTLAITDPWALPMLVAPRPWLTLTSGGYLSRQTMGVRLRDDPMHAEVLKCADAEGLLDTVKRGLDVLGSTAWRINTKVLAVQIDMWNAGIDIRTLAPFPSADQTRGSRPLFADYANKADYVRARQEWQRQCQRHSELLSTRCDSNYKLEIARMFAQVDRFYLPHSMDFRGRAYTVPPHLSHISSDTARGLLLFADGRALGARGLFWLKVHLANMHGYDKASLDDRVAYTDQHLPDIVQSATSPDTGHFWRKADSPWQCLAACIELHSALAHPEGPECYPSRLPVQQDGSCNGLQHYAALGGDPDGAAKVNLAPSAKPQDVYRSVSDLVAARIEADLACAGLSPAERLVAEKLRGRVNRKIVKTTVMTNVYGVTAFGAKEQLAASLKEAGLFADDDPAMSTAKSYLVKQVFSSLKELFVQAKEIQDWLTAAAQEIVHALPLEAAVHMGYVERKELRDAALFPLYQYRRPHRPSNAEPDCKGLGLKDKILSRFPQTMVSWTTPLNFVVVQPYSRPQTLCLHTTLQRISIRAPGPADPVDLAKQAAAFPPNYIHSLDATHMFMTALQCFDAQIAFASVHDCFWTHASTVDAMSGIIREQFVQLYSEPVLERTREEFLTRYKGYKVPVRRDRVADGDSGPAAVWRPIHFPPVPPRGPFELSQVLKSRYFFS